MTLIEEKSFFEHLQFADSERVHSEFFSWLLSPECLAISESQKINFIEKCFKLEEKIHIIKTATEIDDIDIFIETNNSILIIENKLKSFQHSNQLERYKELVEKKYPKKAQCFAFLTLVKEQSINNGWIHISYYDILQELKELSLLEHRHSFFVEDYILFLERLLSVLNDVMAKPREFSCVFENGSLKKSNKLKLEFKSKKEEFITKNQLETIFQKAFLIKLLDNNEIKNFQGCVGDTRGTALIDFPLEGNISIGDKRSYKTFIQIQGDNIKFAFAIQENYPSSNKLWIFKVIDIFKNFKNQKLNGYSKINSPKELAYVSISKKMDKPYWSMDLEEIVSMITIEIKSGHELTEKLMKEIKKMLVSNA
ncbi:MAG: hypothetical protein H6Q14_132 [Bacteroidetes bacterium]|nr:hypothetical protein [Bacteroidota bacterium]